MEERKKSVANEKKSARGWWESNQCSAQRFAVCNDIQYYNHSPNGAYIPTMILIDWYYYSNRLENVI